MKKNRRFYFYTLLIAAVLVGNYQIYLGNLPLETITVQSCSLKYIKSARKKLIKPFHR